MVLDRFSLQTVLQKLFCFQIHPLIIDEFARKIFPWVRFVVFRNYPCRQSRLFEPLFVGLKEPMKENQRKVCFHYEIITQNRWNPLVDWIYWLFVECCSIILAASYVILLQIYFQYNLMYIIPTFKSVANGGHKNINSQALCCHLARLITSLIHNMLSVEQWNFFVNLQVYVGAITKWFLFRLL